MELIKRFLVFIAVVVIAATLISPTQAQILNDNVECGDDSVKYITDQVYAKLQSKIVSLEEKTQAMEHTLKLQEKQIQVLKNYKDFRCESGNVGQHTTPPPTWPYTQSITFQSPFEQAPTVTYGLYLLDSAWNKNVRVVTEVSSVTKTGFQIKMYKWADTVLYGGRISWMACGNMKLIRSILLLASVPVMAVALISPTENDNAQCGNEFIKCLTDQLYARLRPKIVSLEEKDQTMELTLNLQKKQIETLQNRKEFRCESGVLGQHAAPPPTWPYTQSVTFQSPFVQAPTVTYGLYLLDSAGDKNLRVTTDILSVTNTGFQIKINTWADTQLYGARTAWMACGV